MAGLVAESLLTLSEKRPPAVNDQPEAATLLRALAWLRGTVAYDLQLASLHQQALRTDPVTPQGYAVVFHCFFDFCERWEILASPEHEARPLLKLMYSRLRGYAEGSEAFPTSVRKVAEVFESHWLPLRHLTLKQSAEYRRPLVAVRVRPRERRARSRTRSRASPGGDDPPDESDSSGLGRAPRGRLGVEAA
jgi:hypothetical protein